MRNYVSTHPNGPVAASLLSCAFALLGLVSVSADGSKRLASSLAFYKPTGPLSGVTTLSVAGWLICWAVLASRWRNRTLNFPKVSALSFLFLALGLLLTFPPFGDVIARQIR
jgi:membrane associated rhomboid family serine protease